MSAGFTPGPWRIDPDATFIGDHYVGTDQADIALMADWSIDLEPEQWANARLIAAAPDLYDALRLVLDTYGYDSSTDSSIWQTVTSAIAKAEGE